MLSYLKEQSKSGSVSDAAFVGLVWEGLMSGIDMQTKPDQLNDVIVAEAKVCYACSGGPCRILT